MSEFYGYDVEDEWDLGELLHYLEVATDDLKFWGNDSSDEGADRYEQALEFYDRVEAQLRRAREEGVV